MLALGLALPHTAALGMARKGHVSRQTTSPRMQMPPPIPVPTAKGTAGNGVQNAVEPNRQGSMINQRMGAGSFDSPEAVTAWLRKHGVDPAAAGWGRPGTKSVGNLFTEIELGETELEAFGSSSSGAPSGVRRRCTVVKVGVSRPGVPSEVLVEKEQVFADGTRKCRGRPLSEKVLPLEEPLEAARRGVVEELGPALGPEGEASIDLNESSLESWVEISDSRSYPCLPTRYLLHSVTATVDTLPAGAFTTLEICAEATLAAAKKSTLQSRRRRRPLKPVSKRRQYEAAAQAQAQAVAAVQQQQQKEQIADILPAAAAPGLDPDYDESSMEVLSKSGRPLLLPDQLLHVWEWVPASQLLSGHKWRPRGVSNPEQNAQRDAEAERAFHEEAASALIELGLDIDDFDLDAAYDDRFAFDEQSFELDESYASDATDGTRAAAMSEDTGGCVMYVDPEGRYRVVCSNLDLDEPDDRMRRRRRSP